MVFALSNQPTRLSPRTAAQRRDPGSTFPRHDAVEEWTPAQGRARRADHPPQGDALKAGLRGWAVLAVAALGCRLRADRANIAAASAGALFTPWLERGSELPGLSGAARKLRRDRNLVVRPGARPRRAADGVARGLRCDQRAEGGVGLGHRRGAAPDHGGALHRARSRRRQQRAGHRLLRAGAERQPRAGRGASLSALSPAAEPDAFDRAEIDGGALARQGLELLWVNDRVEAFFLHVQGSGRVRLDSGEVVRVGFAGTNEREYASIGKAMVDAGIMTKEEASLQTIRAYLKRIRTRSTAGCIAIRATCSSRKRRPIRMSGRSGPSACP